VLPVGRPPQSGYKYRTWNGPVGPLGEDTLFFFQLNVRKLRAARVGVGFRTVRTLINFAGQRSEFNQLIKQVARTVQDFALSEIAVRVPEDSGDLKRSMVRVIERSNTADIDRGIHVRIGTPNIDYAKPLNALRKSSRTSRGNPYVFHRGGVFHFYDLVVFRARKLAKKTYIDLLTGRVDLDEVENWFTIRYKN